MLGQQRPQPHSTHRQWPDPLNSCSHPHPVPATSKVIVSVKFSSTQFVFLHSMYGMPAHETLSDDVSVVGILKQNLCYQHQLLNVSYRKHRVNILPVLLLTYYGYLFPFPYYYLICSSVILHILSPLLWSFPQFSCSIYYRVAGGFEEHRVSVCVNLWRTLCVVCVFSASAVRTWWRSAWIDLCASTSRRNTKIGLLGRTLDRTPRMISLNSMRAPDLGLCLHLAVIVGEGSVRKAWKPYLYHWNSENCCFASCQDWFTSVQRCQIYYH